MKHIKKFETLSFQNEVMDVFEEVLDEFSIIHDDTGFPPNNSISYEVLESDSESTIIRMHFRGDKEKDVKSVKKFIEEELEPRYENMGMSVEFTWSKSLLLSDGGRTHPKLMITIIH